jgi:hypothetical protein
MARTTLTTEEGAELKRLYEEHTAASNHAGTVLHTYGMASAEFAEADAATGVLWRRIRDLLGEDRNWMS